MRDWNTGTMEYSVFLNWSKEIVDINTGSRLWAKGVRQILYLLPYALSIVLTPFIISYYHGHLP